MKPGPTDALAESIQLLHLALSDRRRRRATLDKLQSVVDEYLLKGEETPAWSILGDLIYDLAFFEPSRRKRAEASALYGEEELELELRAALSKLAALGYETDPASVAQAQDS